MKTKFLYDLEDLAYDSIKQYGQSINQPAFDLTESEGCWVQALTAQGKRYFKARYGSVAKGLYRTFVGMIPEGYLVKQKCKTPNCIKPTHLSIHLDGRRKLIPIQVKAIRKLYQRGYTQETLGKKFGVTQPYIHKVLRGGV